MPRQTTWEEDRALVQRCIAGDGAAVRQFQELFGELIYAFPIRAYRVPAEEAGDFYLFAFEDGRLFRRLRTYAGKVPLRSYLAGFVLDHLVLEWKRRERTLETVSLDSLAEQDRGFAAELAADAPAEDGARPSWEEALAKLPLQRAIVLKLLHVEDAEFVPEELRYLAKASGQTLRGVIDEIERLRAIVRERETMLRRLDDQLESIQGWMRLYRRRLARLEADAAGAAPGSPAAQKIAAERCELERKLKWREQQRQRLVQQLQRRKVTTPYKEIARLLGTTIGNVASQILRVRKELARHLGALEPLPKDRERGV
ncbi:MAG: hypothetical protein N3C12_01785 [Candidatus Binatia bacterium]|nr:hypothetical protein [Candidatus Binatia bacterium]